MEIPPKLVDSVHSIDIWIEHGEDDSTLAIKAVGKVESSNWTNGVLEYRKIQMGVPDNIHPYDVYEFEFYAKPPQVGERYFMEPTDIEAVMRWPGYPNNIKVIRVIGAKGHQEKWVELGGPGTSFKDIPVDDVEY